MPSKMWEEKLFNQRNRETYSWHTVSGYCPITSYVLKPRLPPYFLKLHDV